MVNNSFRFDFAFSGNLLGHLLIIQTSDVDKFEEILSMYCEKTL